MFDYLYEAPCDNPERRDRQEIENMRLSDIMSDFSVYDCPFQS